MKFVLILSLTAFVFAQDESPVVDTHYGKVKGSTGFSRDGRIFYQFKGINYAKVPHRFQPSEIPDNWDGVKDATEYGPKCPQYDRFSKEFVGQLDCLSVNVFTPKLPKEGEHKVLLPVVVLLHPGHHLHGSGNAYLPKYFMDEAVVMVTINSRLGPFGYLNTGDKYASGNMGIKDQSAALRWVQQNIENFGGDKSRVTLSGISSGAADTLLHIVNPLSKGLFHGAIIQSGNPLSPSSFVRDPIKQAKKLGEQVGCPVDSSQNLVKCLNELEPLDILKKMKMPDEKDYETSILNKVKFGPSVETILEGQTENDVVVSDHPFKFIKSGNVPNKVPIVLGVTDHDGLNKVTATIINNPEKMTKIAENWNEKGPILLNFKDTATDSASAVQKVKEFYFPDGKLDAETLIKMVTDRYYASPIRATSIKHSKYAPSYLYYFAHNPVNHLLDSLNLTVLNGTAHLDDSQYFYNLPDFTKVPEITKDSTESEYTLSKNLVKLWTSFFENGKPTKFWGDGQEWNKIEKTDKASFYKIGVETHFFKEEPEVFTKRMNFWKDLFLAELAPELETPPKEHF